MYDKYLVTGATGFLGRAVVEALARRGTRVHALVLQNDPYINLLPKEVHTVIGDVCAKNSLADFFADADSRTCVIHCAGIVSVASRPGPRLYQVNVGGTRQLLQQCMAHKVGKLVYVSSVHAIPEKPKGCLITEDCKFSPGLVDGDYAKSKATATELVYDAAACGLNASIVFPSGIIGPDDLQGGASPQWQDPFLPGSCLSPFAADMTLWMCGMWQMAFSPVPKAESPVKATFCPATMSRSAECCRSSGRRQNGGIGPSACLWVLQGWPPVLRAPELEGSKAIVFHPIFHFRSCLKRLLQPCGCIEVLCISAAPAGADPARIWPHGSLHRRKRARRCLISSGAPRSAAPAAELLCVSAFCSTSGLFLRVCCFLSLRLSSCFSSEIRIY